jgi:cytochrome c peroxidase
VGRLQFALFAVVLGFGSGASSQAADPSDSIELGERLFKDPRFSHSRDFSCVTCHFSPDSRRGYADFEARTPIPLRIEENREASGLPGLTLRNTTALIDLFWGEKPGRPNLLHSDGEFETPEALVIAGLTGRNMGWLESERMEARVRIAEVARLYPEIVAAGQERRVAASWTEDELISRVASLISAYMRSLEFSKDEQGEFNGSPYDAFLRDNRLPTRPEAGESPKEYGARLVQAIEAVERRGGLKWVHEGPKGASMERHEQAFRFAAPELEGLKIFYASPSPGPNRARSGVGNCATCHAPPAFTDFRFHNTGASQEEYDGVHGFGKFMRLAISEQNRAGFASIPHREHPERADLGAWNQVGRSHPVLSIQIFETLCELVPMLPTCELSSGGFEAEVREASIGAFKTPTLRNLGHSEPYLHTGSRPGIASAIQMYIPAGALARKGWLRSGDPEMKDVILTGRDLAPLTAFLEALNEDYE